MRSKAPGSMDTVTGRLATRGTTFSVEFFPPRNDAENETLWRSVRQLERLGPAYVSVTYGAGGSSRDRTIETAARIVDDTSLLPVAHLAAVGHSLPELRTVIGRYAGTGVRNILAVRGDPPGDPNGEWIAHPNGMTYAEQLVRLCRELGDFCVGVTAYCNGHPRSADLDSDTVHLVGKMKIADFAITQLFFEPEDYLRLRDRVTARGCDIPVVPGVMPWTTPRALRRAAQLAEANIPETIRARLEPLAGSPPAFRSSGMDMTAELCDRLLSEGVASFHFYSLNRARAIAELVDTLGLVGGFHGEEQP